MYFNSDFRNVAMLVPQKILLERLRSVEYLDFAKHSYGKTSGQNSEVLKSMNAVLPKVKDRRCFIRVTRVASGLSELVFAVNICLKPVCLFKTVASS